MAITLTRGKENMRGRGKGEGEERRQQQQWQQRQQQYAHALLFNVFGFSARLAGSNGNLVSVAREAEGGAGCPNETKRNETKRKPENNNCNCNGGFEMLQKNIRIRRDSRDRAKLRIENA